jgi:putative membrane protein insertion efficiency factor
MPSLPSLQSSHKIRAPARARRRASSTPALACLKCVTSSSTQRRRLVSVSIRSSSDKAPAAETAEKVEKVETAEESSTGRETVDRRADSASQVDEFDDKSETLPVKIALSMLQFYKTGISPLMQPSCRFQPTCSSYAVDAYTRYGVTKGTIMTAWRLFRCTPWGDRGYDPAVWPPKGLQFLENI